MIIAIDFDGTCVCNQFPDVGPPVPGCVEVLKDLVAGGHRLILWTVRSGKRLDDAVTWFTFQGVPLWGINKNPGQHAWSDSPKAHADLFIDDRALGIPVSVVAGDFVVNWAAVRGMLEERGVLTRKKMEVDAISGLLNSILRKIELSGGVEGHAA